MQYSVWPTSRKRTPIPRLPFRPPDDYLRNAMVASLAEGDVAGELTTPTGAAILKTLVSRFGPAPAMTILNLLNARGSSA